MIKFQIVLYGAVDEAEEGYTMSDGDMAAGDAVTERKYCDICEIFDEHDTEHIDTYIACKRFFICTKVLCVFILLSWYVA